MNGFFVPHLDIYEHGVNISYGCDTGLKPALETWWGEITCNEGQWSHNPQCIDKTHCSPHVPNTHAEKPLKTSYAPNEDFHFKCEPDFEFESGNSKARCENGKWMLPKCTRKPEFCAPPPRVFKGMIIQPYQDAFKNGARLDYVCAEGYKIEGNNYNVCENGRWTNSPTCVEKSPCSSKPAVQNARPADKLKRSYNHGDTVQFICNRGYRFEDTDSAQCEDGTWKLPGCIDPTRCTAPRVANARPTGSLESSYSSGTYVRFQCDYGYEFKRGDPYATCVDGTWRLPVCQKLCGRPSVPNARSTEGLSTSYSTGSYVTFQCDSGYEFVGLHYAKCVDGNWELPVCKSRDETVCSAPRVPNARPAVDLTSFYATGRTVRFVCDSGYEFEGTDTAWCEDGIWRLPVCKVRNCGTQPLIENGDVTELPDGNELKAQCKKLYKLTGPGTIRCVNGKWTELPVCKPPCKLDRTKILHTYHPDEYLQEGERKRFYCSNRYQIDISCTKGTTVYGECKCILCFIETKAITAFLYLQIHLSLFSAQLLHNE
ncbi:complement factor H-like isoform X3 [Ictalurus furcatus]|uniref:complement factor H-like isoform X3 n=1 Tax=Ictalurus furcatus TaxID=66913 RepID=UPI0023509567|nr:complement factor H-like isoform X3 [Ictalurus furcatus]